MKHFTCNAYTSLMASVDQEKFFSWLLEQSQYDFVNWPVYCHEVRTVLLANYHEDLFRTLSLRQVKPMGSTLWNLLLSLRGRYV